MSVKYALHPGPVISKRDGQKHFIGAHQLAALYRVSMKDCLVVPWEVRGPGEHRQREMLLERIKQQGLINLGPRHSGDYTLPQA